MGSAREAVPFVADLDLRCLLSVGAKSPSAVVVRPEFGDLRPFTSNSCAHSLSRSAASVVATQVGGLIEKPPGWAQVTASRRWLPFRRDIGRVDFRRERMLVNTSSEGT